jgi:hypothetical protein
MAPMQAQTPESFQREMGCTARELVAWLPRACGGRPLCIEEGSARVVIDGAQLLLAWQTLAPRQIASLRLPRLAVSFRFEGVDAPQRREFIRIFDLSTQRGGG